MKQCPFCKNDEHIVNSVSSYLQSKQTNTFMFICKKCKALGPEGRSKEEAVELWNKRSPKIENDDCPFCGSNEISTVKLLCFNEPYAITCKNCGAVGPLCETKNDALIKWRDDK